MRIKTPRRIRGVFLVAMNGVLRTHLQTLIHRIKSAITRKAEILGYSIFLWLFAKEGFTNYGIWCIIIIGSNCKKLIPCEDDAWEYITTLDFEARERDDGTSSRYTLQYLNPKAPKLTYKIPNM